MSSLIIRATISLTPYAQEHQEELRFVKQELLPAQEEQIQTRKLNWFSKCVKKVDSSNSKIVAFSRTVFKIVLIISLVGIPFFALWRIESSLLAEDVKTTKVRIEKLNLRNQQWNKRAEIEKNIGIKDFANLPVLDLQDRMGETDYIDFLKSEDLPAPIMKGLDKFKRPFIAIKMTNKTNLQVCIVALFQRYTDDTRWVWVDQHGSYARPSLSNYIQDAIVGSKEAQVFGQIIQGKHPQFKLYDSVLRKA